MVGTDNPQPRMIVLLAIKSAETIIIVENGSLILSPESRSRLEEFLADRCVKECDQASNKTDIECVRSLTYFGSKDYDSLVYSRSQKAR